MFVTAKDMQASVAHVTQELAALLMLELVALHMMASVAHVMQELAVLSTVESAALGMTVWVVQLTTVWVDQHTMGLWVVHVMQESGGHATLALVVLVRVVHLFANRHS